MLKAGGKATLAMALLAAAAAVAAPYPPEIMAWTETDRQQQIAAGKTQYDALVAAYKGGAASYTIPPGHYRWGVGGKTKYLLNDMANFTISAYGATFWVDTDAGGTSRGGFSFGNCTNVVLAGVTVDCHPLPFTQGRVVAWNQTAKTIDVALDAGYPTLLDQGVATTGRIGFFSEDGEQWLDNRTDTANTISLIADRTLRLAMAAGRNFLPDENLHVGKRIALLRESGANPFAEDHRCKGVTFKDCTCYASAGMVFSGQGEDIVIDSAHCIRRPGTDRLLGFTTTGHHSSLRNGVHLKNSEFSYSMDDFMNMDTVANYVFQKEDDTTFLLFSRNIGILDGAPFDPGDTMLFYTYNTFYRVGEATVVSVAQITDPALVAEARAFPNATAAAYGNPSRDFPNGGLWRVVFDAALPAKATDWCYSTAYACEGALFENCRFFNGGQTAGRICLGSDSIVRNCTFENIRSVAIIAGWNQASMNGPVIHNLLIENNTFVNCGYHLRSLEPTVEALGTISIVNVFFSELCDSAEAHDIVIRNNTFTNSALCAIQINNARDCTIEGNTIIRAGARMPLGAGAIYGATNAAFGIFLHSVSNSTATNNTMRDFTAYTKGFIGITPYTPLAGNSLHVDGHGPLTTNPAAVIQAPAGGATVPLFATLPVQVNAGNHNGTVASAELLLDGNPVAASTNAPYHFVLPTYGLAPGTHSLQIRVHDRAAGQGLSLPATFQNPDPAADADADGHTALDEYVWGTSDADPASRFAAQLAVPPGVPASIGWDGVAERTYRLWRSHDLAEGAWELLQTIGPLASNQAVEVIDSGAAGTNAAFYRIEGGVSL